MLRIGIIGFGGNGHHHFKGLSQMGEFAKVVAIADKREEKRADIPEGIHAYEDGVDLLKNEELDVVYISVPTYLHTKFAVMAMEKGCDVFLEKPVCMCEEEAELLLETQKKTGAKVQVGVVCRFDAPWVFTKNLIDSGKYGKVISGEFYRQARSCEWSWNNWYDDPDMCGTVALDLHIHNVDTIRWYMGGDPDSFDVEVIRDEEGVIQHIYTTYLYGDAVIRAVDTWALHDTFGFHEPYLVHFEKATVEFDGRKLITIYEEDGEKRTVELVSEVEMKADENDETNLDSLDGFYTEDKFFLTQIIPGKAEEKASLADAIKSTLHAHKEIAKAGGRKLKK